MADTLLAGMVVEPGAQEMPRSRGLTVGARVSLWMTAAVGAVLAAFVALDVVQTHAEFHREEREILRSIIPALGRLVESAMLRGDRAHIEQVFSDLEARGAFGSVELLDEDRRVVRTRDFLDPAGAVGRRDPAAVPEHSAAVEMAVSARAECARCHARASGTLGYVRLTAPLRRSRPALLRHAKIRLAMALAALGAAALLCAWIARSMVGGPLARIGRALDRVREGNLAARLRPNLPGEFGLVASRFNAMAEAMERGEREIADLHHRQAAHVDRLASLGELGANFAHEVRNPLTGIGSAIQVLRRGMPEGDERREVLAKILVQVDRLNRALDSFLHYSRLPDPDTRPFHVREPVQRARFLLEDRLKSQGIEFRADMPETLPLAAGDPGQLQQVLLNLFLNAAQAMPRGGALRVEAREADGAILVQVRDTGIGIRPEVLERAFQPFFTTRKDGSGLGLPIARQLVEANGGRLQLESAPGSGTTASLTLPRAPRGGAPAGGTGG